MRIYGLREVFFPGIQEGHIVYVCDSERNGYCVRWNHKWYAAHQVDGKPYLFCGWIASEDELKGE